MKSIKKRSTQHLRRGFTLLEVLVVIGIIGIIMALLLPAVQSARESMRRSECQNHLHQIGLALANYHSAYNHLPAASIRPKGSTDNGRDQPRATWAIAILPMLELGAIHDDFVPTQDTTADANQKFRESVVGDYMCPTETNIATWFEPIVGARFSRSNYAANFGSSSWGVRFWEATKYRGVMGQNTRLAFSHIADGLSQTVAIAEISVQGDYSDNRGVWAFHAAGASSVGLDCDVKCQGINGDSESDFIPYCISNPNGLKCSFQNTEESNAGPRSLHPGGAQLLNCDGSVQFVAQEIDIKILVDRFTSLAGNAQ